MKNVVAIIQARMESTRLPGKVMMPLGGQTVLSHVLNRCNRIKNVNHVCCAISDKPSSDVLEKEAKRCGATVFRGSEDDVLERYYLAAKMLGADVILRVTSDCPIIDPNICEHVIRQLEDNNADYACNNMPPSWPHGLDCEAFTFSWLEKANFEARKPFEREHVTPFIREHPGAVRVNYSGPGKEVESHRWTLDTKQDNDFFKELFRKTENKCAGMSWSEILNVVQQNKELAAINAGHDRYVV